MDGRPDFEVGVPRPSGVPIPGWVDVLGERNSVLKQARRRKTTRKALAGSRYICVKSAHCLVASSLTNPDLLEEP